MILKFTSVVVLILVSSVQCEDLSKEAVDPCLLQIDRGTCSAEIKKFAFNAETGACEIFSYSGCGGNANRFDTQEECERVCLTPKIQPRTSPKPPVVVVTTSPPPVPTPRAVEVLRENPCQLDADAGPCLSRKPRFFYNRKTKQCELFYYGGCQGNSNNFQSKEECEAKCGVQKQLQPEPEDIEYLCQLKADPGPCLARVPKFYYNAATKQCELFYYGGCEGNRNNFDSKAQCEAVCSVMKQQPQEPSTGPRPEPRQVVGTQLRPEPRLQPQRCVLPLEQGSCLANIPQYGYDVNRQQCVEFVYGGCGGNENRFASLAECRMVCEQTQGPTTPVGPRPHFCNLMPDQGQCFAYRVQYGYDPRNNRCFQFAYGGCGGNQNRFNTLAECERTCVKAKAPPTPSVPIPAQCLLRPDPGQCTGYEEKYAFDSTRGQCIKFVYGGCGGNTNQFTTLAECEQTCRPTALPPVTTPTPIPAQCALRPDSGPCGAYQEMYAYDTARGKCIKFVYGGCEGNANRFNSLAECELVCRQRTVTPPTSVVVPAQCLLKPDSGPCTGYQEKYAFDSSRGQCIKFVYGGCEGNANQFNSLAECENTCRGSVAPPVTSPSVPPFAPPPAQPSQTPPRCTQVPSSGTCTNYTKKYAYDYQRRQCFAFLYGGCGGNSNRFDTLADCLEICGDRAPSLGYTRTIPGQPLQYTIAVL